MGQQNVVIAGFGGQGVMLVGELLAYAGMIEGKHVTWVPSYGIEMRGGTAHCTVTIDDEEINSPVAEEPESVIVFNGSSLEKFEPLLPEGGLLLINSAMVDRESERHDIRTYTIAANNIADKLGNSQVSNIIMLGAFIELSGMVSMESVVNALQQVLPERHHRLLPLNRQALEMGAASVKTV